VEALLAHRLYAEFRAEDEAAGLAVEGLLLELLAAVARSGAVARHHAPRWAAVALSLLRDAPGERHSLASVASEVGVHPATLARGFRRAYGCSVGTMQRRLRLEYAARQLATTTWPLARIAQMAGFYDQSHFTNAFRRHLGRSPLQYRRAIGTPS
jgi:AraC family transcriptional regulator